MYLLVYNAEKQLVSVVDWAEVCTQEDCALYPMATAYQAIDGLRVDKQYLRAYQLPKPSALQPDERFMGKIKWYVTPLVFGGDPGESRNITWVTHEQHSQLVMWWNQQYDRARRADFKR